MRKLRVTLNIGLNDNPFTVGTIVSILASSGNANLKFRIEKGEWDGIPEETLVVSFDTKSSKGEIHRAVRGLAELTNQDCIAVLVVKKNRLSDTWKTSSWGDLIWRTTAQDKSFLFNEGYFFKES